MAIGNTTIPGWNNLTQGYIVEAVYESANAALFGYFFLLLFVVISTAIYVKTRSMSLCFTLGLMFLGIGYFALPIFVFNTILIILLFELAIILYQGFWG